METTHMADLVERGEELRRLGEHCARACDGAGRTVVIVGEAGIGKSALLRATAELAGRSGMRVLTARAAEIEQDYPFGLVRQLLEPLLLDRGERRAELFAGPAASAAYVFSPPTGVTVPSAEHNLAILHGLYMLLASLARERQILLCLDDLQWADAPSLRFLLFLTRRVASSPILAVGTLRDGERVGALGELVDDPETAVLAPRALGVDGVGELMERYCGRRPAVAVEALVRASGGNPFFVLSLLTEAGEDVTSVAGLDSAAPDPVVRSVERRLAPLSTAARTLVSCLAVLGEEADLALTGRLAGLDPGEAEDASAALVSVGLLRVTDGAMFFRHPIVRDAVYATIAPSRRSLMHARAAMVLAEIGASLDGLAAQLVRSPAPNPQAVAVLREAAQDAMGRGAPEAACAYLERVLQEPLVSADRADVLLALGIAQARAGLPHAVESLGECVAVGMEPSVRAEATIALARMLNAVGRPTDAVLLLGRPASDVDAWPADIAARLREELLSLADVDLASRGLALSHAGPLETASDLVPDPFECAHLAVARLMAGEDAAATAKLADRALRDDVMLRATQTGSSHFFLLVFALTVAGDFSAATEHAEAALEQARAGGSMIAFALASWARGMVALRRGSLAGAEAELQSSLDVIALDRLPTIAHLVFVHLIDLMIERGEPHRVAPAAAGVGLDLERLDAGTQGTILQGMRGRLRIAEGRAAEGVDDVLTAAERLASWGVVNPGLYHWHTDAILALHATGQTERAQELAAEQLRRARVWGAPRAVADALRASALLERGSVQVEQLQAARDALVGSGAELMRARVLTDLGAALRRCNSRAAAREPLTEALELALACGARRLAERAHTELWATGARPHMPLRTGVENLTPSELRIARLAAAGQSNAEIANDLFITVKTVEMHLTRAYRKLGIDSRRDLATLLADGAAGN